MEGSKQAQPGTVALFWVEKLRGASFPVPFCRWWVLRLLTGDLSQQLKSQEFLRLVYIYCQKKMWYFNWHSSLRFCLTWLSKAGQLLWIWGHRAVVKHEQWTECPRGQRRWDGKQERKRGSHCSGAARLLHDRESHEILLGSLGWRSWEYEMDILFGYGYFALLKSVIYKNAKLEVGQVKDWEFVIT